MMVENSQYAGAAQNFIQAYANTNYLQPLKGDDIDRFYVSRGPTCELNRLLTELKVGAQMSPSPYTKFLFVGHTGSGKSTELSRLVKIIESETEEPNLHRLFLPIQYSISEVVGLYNIEFIDIAMSMVLGLYREIERRGYTISESQARQVYDWLYQNHPSTRPAAYHNRDNNLDLGLDNLIRLIDLRLKSDGATREKLRAHLRKYVPELIELVNQVINQVALISGKNILLIIDDLDKIQPIEVALRIFKEHARTLTSFNCFVIYTAPVSLLYDPALKYLEQFLEIYYMPMFKVRTQAGNPQPSNSPDVNTLRQIICRRVRPTLFDPGIIEMAIDITGGILRELIRVIRGCCMYCEEYGLQRITLQVLEYQKHKLKAEYYRTLERSDYWWLRRVKSSKSRIDVNLHHLDSLCVLHYSDSTGWFDLHPLVIEILKEFEPADQAPALKIQESTRGNKLYDNFSRSGRYTWQ